MKVMFCCPAYRGLVCPPFLDSLEATAKLFEENGIDCCLNMIPGCGSIQLVRNEFVKQFLESDYDYLFFLDDDISWDAKDALRLVQADRDICAGIYPLKAEIPTPEPFAVVTQCTDDGKALVDDDGYLIAARAPTGFMCIKRNVFEGIRAAYPHLEYEDKSPNETEYTTRFDYFPQGVYHRRWLGEDFAFCGLWTGIGGHVTVIPDMTLGHHSQKQSWYGNFYQYIKSLPGGEDYGKEGKEGFWTDRIAS